MIIPKDYQPEYETLRTFLIRMTEERSAAALPDMVVRQMASRPHVAMARVWLLRQGDLCTECEYAPVCTDRSSCLHLVASAGRPIKKPAEEWASLNGWDRRVSLTCPGSGEAVRTGIPLIIPHIDRNPEWMARNPWARGEHICCMSCYPIVFKEEVLGLVATYIHIDPKHIQEGPFWMTMIANQMAVTMANAQALDQIERLRAQLELENSYLREEVVSVGAFGDIIGKSPPLANLLEQVNLVAPTNASVLILGESGTGKELLAREIHRRSLRHDRPMIKVNCAAVPVELYESEFFGHVKGAFTGAISDRAGRFQAADGGTLFLDEVGEIPFSLQSKLLRVLQEGVYERIGDETPRQVDVRIIAATNHDIKKEVAAGLFRQDLYYRLNVFPIEVVPLRQRKEDIPLLANHLLKLISNKMSRQAPCLTSTHIAALQAYEWPGNIRELQNVIERAVITARLGRLQLDVPSELNSSAAATFAPRMLPSLGKTDIMSEGAVRKLIRSNIIAALQACGGKIYGTDGAAALLNMSPTTLSSRILRMKIREDATASKTYIQ